MARRVDAKAPIELRLVLEVEPYRYSNCPLPVVAGARQHPAEWGEYFRRCMADAGYEGVLPIKEGSSFVSARNLAGSALLERMIREAVDGSGLPGFPLAAALEGHDPADRIAALPGGLALLSAGEALLAVLLWRPWRHQVLGRRVVASPVAWPNPDRPPRP